MLTNIKTYMIELDSFAINYVVYLIKDKGIEKAIESLFNDIDCTRIGKDGIRIIQTIDFSYKNAISQLIYAIEKIEDKTTKLNYLSRVISVHNNNLVYEQENEPVIYLNKRQIKAKAKRANNLPRKRVRDDAESVKAKTKSIPYKELFKNTNLIHNFKIKGE